MMAVLKLCRVRQNTLSSALDEAGKAMAAQHKFWLHAHQYCHRVDACGRAQQEVEEIRGIANYRLQQWGQTARERDELHNQLMNLTIDRDEAAQELDHVTHHRDAALELAEERCRGWILANHNAFQREQALQEQLEELQVEHHQLHNRLFSIPRPIPRYPNVGGPQVIEADEEEEDVQMVDNAAELAKEEEEEEDPEEVQGVSDVDSDHIDE